ncbi:Uncharacterised protein [BD1-7 clade bacterium]|uniref:Uncharacterized protein n=1 Tax=BD1-7 clade bacterium TaxID=2029982 RepID=A0A5S9MNT4_9GAMM|nr:Uncharacterised protein [BD1-7 clade bacterium]CAA0085162.1 Uncharacterised protein [BD1-7 clade bacterium]
MSALCQVGKANDDSPDNKRPIPLRVIVADPFLNRRAENKNGQNNQQQASMYVHSLCLIRAGGPGWRSCMAVVVDSIICVLYAGSAASL